MIKKTLKAAATAAEAELIKTRLAQHRGDINATAASLGVSTRTLWRKIGALGIDHKTYRSDLSA